MAGNRKWNAREILSAQAAADCGHDAWCKWPNGAPCLRFSTDGTRLGADIAHTMGTTDEAVIAAGRAPASIEDGDDLSPFHSDVDAEQADWDDNEQEPCYTCSGYGCAECRE